MSCTGNDEQAICDQIDGGLNSFAEMQSDNQALKQELRDLRLVEQQTIRLKSEKFVNKYPNMFTEDRKWWIDTLTDFFSIKEKETK